MRKRLVLSIVLLGIVLVSFYLNRGKSEVVKPAEITFETSTFENPSFLPKDLYEVSLDYPQIKSGLDVTNIAMFNDIASKSAERIFEETKAEFFSDDPELIKEIRINNTEIVASLGGDYKIERADHKIISFRFDFTIGSQGQAHSNQYTESVNYSPLTKRVLSLSDLFKAKSNYLNVISKLTRKKLIEGYKNDGSLDEGLVQSFIDPGTTPDAKNFRSFVIGKDYLTFIFDPYDVGPHSAGTREAKIMFSELNSVLNKRIL